MEEKRKSDKAKEDIVSLEKDTMVLQGKMKA